MQDTSDVSEAGGQLLPNLYFVSWLGMTPGQLDCHVFVLRGPTGLLLVDCGTPWGFERICRNMAHWNLAVEDVRTVLLTHAHVDHVSGGYRFKELGAEILGHQDILTPVECQWEATGALVKVGVCYRMDGTLADGDRLSRCGFDIEVRATPGHTRGCLSFRIAVDGQQCLFSGDLLMSDGLPGYHGDPGYGEADIVASMAYLLTEEFQHLCFGHGALLDDRGSLFRTTLANHAAGTWHARDSRLMQPIQGRKPAAF